MHPGQLKSQHTGGRLLLAVLAAWIGLLTFPANADDARNGCFCLAHPSGTMLRGCFAYQAKSDFYATALCSDPETVQESEQMITQEWQRIESGKDRCKQCLRQRPENDPEIPRGGREAGSPFALPSSGPANEEPTR
jgi:hypothetical protein